MGNTSFWRTGVSGGTGISRPTQSVKSIRFVVAGSLFSNLFESMVATLFECRAGIVAESRELAELRDYFLPKLLSGQIRLAPPPNDRHIPSNRAWQPRTIGHTLATMDPIRIISARPATAAERRHYEQR